MRTGLVRLALFGTLLLAVSPAGADFKVHSNVKPGWQQPMTVAVVVVQCRPSMDCVDLTMRTVENLTGAMKKQKWQFVPEKRIRQALFDRGEASYSGENREALAGSLNASAFLELSVEAAASGDGYGGVRGSEVNMTLQLVRPNGEVLMQGGGAGRPMNVVGSPEWAGAILVEKILKDALKGGK